MTPEAQPMSSAPAAAAPTTTSAPASGSPGLTTSSPQSVPSTGGTGATAAQPSDWTSGLDEETRGWVQLKGFKDPATVVGSYRNLEKLQGVPASRLVKLPESLDDAQAMGEVYGRLGRPDKPDGYGFKAPEGDNGDFTNWAQQNFYEAGLSTKQGQALMAKYGEFATQMQKAQADAQTAKTVEGQAALKKEWGMAHDQNQKVAARGARLAGVDSNTIDSIERAIGYEKTIKLFHGIGSKTGEDTFVGGGDNGFSAMTPGQAQAKITELRSDPGFGKRYLSGDASAKAEMDRLHRMAYPEQP